MQDQEIINIIKTYELPEKIERYIISIAKTRLKELNFQSFDYKYRYIAELIDKFQIPYNERFNISLDKPIKKDSKSRFDNLIGEERLEKIYDEERISFINSLLQSGDEINPEIREILSEFAEKYKVGNSIILPPRPIVSVNFNPFSIEYGPDYPLDIIAKYWRKNWRKIRNRRNERNEELMREHKDFIFKIYNLYSGNATRAAQNTIYSKGTFLRHWRKSGLEVKISKPPVRYLSEKDKQKIINSYNIYNGNISKASKELHHNQGTISRIWKEAGLENPIDVRALPKEDIEKILEAHTLCNGIAAKAEKYLHHSLSTILKYWKLNGLKVNPPNGKYSNKDKTKIIESHLIYKGNASEASRNLGYAVDTILRQWRIAGLVPPSKIILSKESKQNIIKAYQVYDKNIRKTSRELHHSQETISNIWKTNGLKIKREIGKEENLENKVVN